VFQVEWNPNLATVLASSAADKRVMIWDVNRYVESNQLQSSTVFAVDVYILVLPILCLTEKVHSMRLPNSTATMGPLHVNN
jgi:hypothetical protein